MRSKQQSGFTIVELLIVIVVIAILAAITIVAYNGIQDRARTAKKYADISAIKKKLENYKTLNSSYPVSADVAKTDADFGQSLNELILAVPYEYYCSHAPMTKQMYCLASKSYTDDDSASWYSIIWWDDSEKIWKEEWHFDTDGTHTDTRGSGEYPINITS